MHAPLKHQDTSRIRQVSELTMLTTGFCTQQQALARRGAARKKISFPAQVALIKHPTAGIILFDTGYSEWFFRATKSYPEKLYADLTPVTLPPGATAREQLLARGIQPEEVRIVIGSHFHGDHISGFRDFPKAQFLVSRHAYQAVSSRSRLSRLFSGFLVDLLPDDFEQRMQAIEDTPRLSFLDASSQTLKADREKSQRLAPFLGPFEEAYDLLGDQSLIAVPLPGHSHGHFGLWVHAPKGSSFPYTALVGDACWSTEAYQKAIPPHPIVHKLMLNNDHRAYMDTLTGLQKLYLAQPSMPILPCHCSKGVL